MSITTGKRKLFQQSQLNLRVSRYKLLFLLTNRKILEFPLFSVIAFWGPFLETPDNFPGPKTILGAQYSPTAIQFLLIWKAKF